jgi:hypothetical protein
MTANAIERVIASLQEVMWPDGLRRPVSEPRTEVEKLETRESAGQKLELLIPGGSCCVMVFRLLMLLRHCCKHDWQE